MRVHRVVAPSLFLAAAMAAFGERDARACGGCLQPPPPPGEVESVITDEKMIFSISPAQTTLYDEIEYSGSPADFAWVLPIKGTVSVGLSADILFSTVESLTATTVEAPFLNCPCRSGIYPFEGGSSGGSSGSGGSAGSGGGGVTVTSQKQVGPYQTVQLHSTDGSALNTWLATNGYVLPAADKPVIDAYVAEGFDFLALKLLPGKGVKAMQPVRVTSMGAAPSLPLHMVAVGTGPTTGITIWIFADGRWEPRNFPTFTITDSELTWDWSTSSSNYETLRLSKEAALKGTGWQVESSLELSKTLIQNSLLSAIQYDVGGQGLYSPASSGDGGVDGGDAATADAAEPDASAAVDLAATQDLGVLFAGVSGANVRVTRMRSDVAHSALSVDMVLQASADQSELTNLHTPKKQTGVEAYCGCPADAGNHDGAAGHGGTAGHVGTAGHGGSVGSGPAAAGPANSSGCNTTGSLADMGATLAAIFLGGSIVFVRTRRSKRS